jgi:hypothetical protein
MRLRSRQFCLLGRAPRTLSNRVPTPVLLAPHFLSLPARAGGVWLLLFGVGCMPQPAGSPTSSDQTVAIARLKRENQDLENRLRDVQAERDAGRAALERCRGSATKTDGVATESEQARRDLPVVRLVPDPETPAAGGAGPADERVILRATGDGAGEIAPLPPETEPSEPPLDSGVRFSGSEDSAPASPPKPVSPAEKSPR